MGVFTLMSEAKAAASAEGGDPVRRAEAGVTKRARPHACAAALATGKPMTVLRKTMQRWMAATCCTVSLVL
jgi:hypothetical protein